MLLYHARKGRNRRILVGALTLTAAVSAGTAPALASGPRPGSGVTDADEHAALHAAADRQARRWTRSPEGRATLSSARPWRKLDRVRPVKDSAKARAAAAGSPADIGRWNGMFQLPTPVVHSILLPTGKVLFYSERGKRENTAHVYLYTLGTGALKRVDAPLWRDPGDGVTKPANIFCGGQSLLPDGRVLVTGGNLEYKKQGDPAGSRGLNKVYTFNPYDETWTEQPEMRQGRWYPSQALMANGETLIVGGRDERGVYNEDVEIFTPSPDLNGRGTVRLVSPRGVNPRPRTQYPHLFTMPSGRVLAAGPELSVSGYFNGADASTYSWSDFPDAALHRKWGSAVLMPGGPGGSSRVMQLGGAGYGQSQSTATTEVFDEATNAWTAGSNMQVARGHHNTVLLPDGNMANVGGGFGSSIDSIYAYDATHRQVELTNPDGSWRLGPEQVEGRAYHSTAMLLPDATVLSAGDNGNGGKLLDTGEIYEPPYLHKGGTRPSIEFAPGAVRYGSAFGVGTASPNVSRAVLIAPSATTHGTDMNQRQLNLPVSRRADGRGVDVVAPTGPNAAPPGFYMLFLLDDRGVPSVARFVRLDANAAEARDVPARPGAQVVPPAVRGAAPRGAAPRSGTTPGALRRRRAALGLRTLISRGTSVRARCARACTVSVTLTADRRTARRLRLERRVVGRGSRRLSSRGVTRVKVRLNRKAKRRLARVRSVKLTLRTVVVPKRGKARRSSRTVTYRR